ncbi:hypothetical protein [Streptomyces gulbargensis]
MAAYDFTRRLEAIAAWYGDVLTDLYPAGPDRDVKQLLLAVGEGAPGPGAVRTATSGRGPMSFSS